MPGFPPHTSPAFPPTSSSRPNPVRSFSDLDLNDDHLELVRRVSSTTTASLDHDHDDCDCNHSDDENAPPPPCMISPAFTPPSTPGTGTTTPLPHHLRPAKSIPVDTSTDDTPAPRLVEQLPEVNCIVRARIPTTHGREMFLHLYTNNVDQKEHLAIVFGPYIRSRSLDEVRPGETEMDRMIRGAYTGRLYPGRTTSKPVPAGQGQGHATVAHKAIEKSGPTLQEEGTTSISISTPTALEQPDPLPTNVSAEPPRPASADSGISHLASISPDDFYNPESELSKIPPLVRIHSECYTGETVWSARCDCGEQLDEAARLMSLAPPPASAVVNTHALSPGGVIVYLRQEGRGIGLSEKLKAYNLQDLGNNTVEANLLLRHPADARSYGLATAMLMDLGLGGDRGIRLLTNNPDKVRAVEGPNREVRVRERVAMVPLAWRTGGKEGFRSEEVDQYLRTKVSSVRNSEMRVKLMGYRLSKWDICLMVLDDCIYARLFISKHGKYDMETQCQILDISAQIIAQAGLVRIPQFDLYTRRGDILSASR
jgi:GTP cyclohydrolase II